MYFPEGLEDSPFKFLKLQLCSNQNCTNKNSSKLINNDFGRRAPFQSRGLLARVIAICYTGHNYIEKF